MYLLQREREREHAGEGSEEAEERGREADFPLRLSMELNKGLKLRILRS